MLLREIIHFMLSVQLNIHEVMRKMSEDESVRVKLSKEIVVELEQIKDTHNLGGKGVSSAITFLLEQYKKNETLERILYNHTKKIEAMIVELKEVQRKITEETVKSLLRKVFAPLTQ